MKNSMDLLMWLTLLLENVIAMINDALMGKENKINGSLRKNIFVKNISEIFELPILETDSLKTLSMLQLKLYAQYMRITTLSTRAMALMISQRNVQITKSGDYISALLDGTRYIYSQGRWVSDRCYDVNVTKDQLKSAKRQVQRFVYRHYKKTLLTQTALETLTP